MGYLCWESLDGWFYILRTFSFCFIKSTHRDSERLRTETQETDAIMVEDLSPNYIACDCIPFTSRLYFLPTSPFSGSHLQTSTFCFTSPASKNAMEVENLSSFYWVRFYRNRHWERRYKYPSWLAGAPYGVELNIDTVRTHTPWLISLPTIHRKFPKSPLYFSDCLTGSCNCLTKLWLSMVWKY